MNSRWVLLEPSGTSSRLVFLRVENSLSAPASQSASLPVGVRLLSCQFLNQCAGVGLSARGDGIVLVDGKWICVAAVLSGRVGEKALASYATGGRHLVRTRRDLHKLVNIL